MRELRAEERNRGKTPPDTSHSVTEGQIVRMSYKFPSCIRYASGKFSGKQRISLFTNFPLHVNEGKLVGKEIFCLPLNFPLGYDMHAGNLEDKG